MRRAEVRCAHPREEFRQEGRRRGSALQLREVGQLALCSSLHLQRGAQSRTVTTRPGHYVFLHGDRLHGEPVVRRDGWLHLHHAGGHRAVQREDAAGQAAVQWLREGGGKWQEAAAQQLSFAAIDVTRTTRKRKRWQHSLLHSRLSSDCHHFHLVAEK